MFWRGVFGRGFLKSLRLRGLGGLRLVIADQHAGLVAALRRAFHGASHQRCRVHFARNLPALIPKGHPAMVAAVAGTHDEWQAGDRRDLSEGSMARLYPERDTGAIAELNTGD